MDVLNISYALAHKHLISKWGIFEIEFLQDADKIAPLNVHVISRSEEPLGAAAVEKLFRGDVVQVKDVAPARALPKSGRGVGNGGNQGKFWDDMMRCVVPYVN